jgi:tight adherence protein C
MLHEIQLGKARSDAMRDFAHRVDIPEVRSVIASMIQAEELGASLGPILRIQAAQLRERRSQTAEEKAAA